MPVLTRKKSLGCNLKGCALLNARGRSHNTVGRAFPRWKRPLECLSRFLKAFVFGRLLDIFRGENNQPVFGFARKGQILRILLEFPVEATLQSLSTALPGVPLTHHLGKYKVISRIV